jgi:hypothetical protein
MSGAPCLLGLGESLCRQCMSGAVMAPMLALVQGWGSPPWPPCVLPQLPVVCGCVVCGWLWVCVCVCVLCAGGSTPAVAGVAVE